MEGVGSEYGTVEWIVENFSCWKRHLHNEVITSLNFWGLHFEIRPRGENQEIMSVRILGDSPTEVSGDLSLIDSDGYVFCSAEVDIDTQRPAFEISSAPKFTYVVSRSKMNEGLHEDQITLRFQVRAAVSDSVLYMRTEICVHRFSLRIPGEALYNICLYDLPEQCISTIEYPSGESATAKIDLYTGIYNQMDNMYFKIKKNGSRKFIFIRSHLSAIDQDGTVVESEAKESYFDVDYITVFQYLNKTAVMKKVIYLQWHLGIIPENKYELLCTFIATDQGRKLPTVILSRPISNKYVQKPSENIVKAGTSNQPENPLTVLSNELMCLYQDQKFSDITLKCDNVTFPVHRNILSARSAVLDCLLSCDMKEASSGTVHIEDLDPSTLSRFLTYLYTGVVEDLLDDSALKLYYAADKYQVPSLKRDCSKFLCSNVSILNVCEILSLADKHSDDQLTSVAHDFILKNYNQVLSSDEWGSLVKSDPVLVARTLTHFAQKKSVRYINPQ